MLATDRISLKNMFIHARKTYGTDSEETDSHSEGVFFDSEGDSKGILTSRQEDPMSKIGIG